MLIFMPQAKPRDAFRRGREAAVELTTALYSVCQRFVLYLCWAALLHHPMSHTDPNFSKSGPAKRPSSITELAERALVDLWDETKDFKYYLRVAEKYRKDGKEFARKGDLEGAFIQLARAATLVLEKLPNHRDYNDMLNSNQRHNLALVRGIVSRNAFLAYPSRRTGKTSSTTSLTSKSRSSTATTNGCSDIPTEQIKSARPTHVPKK